MAKKPPTKKKPPRTRPPTRRSALVMRLLAKVPDERPANAAILLEQLAELG